MYSASGVTPPQAHIRVGARVCKFKTPELVDKRVSKNDTIQCEIEALRRIKRVDTGSHTIAKSIIFGGDGSGAPVEGNGKAMSLHAMGVLERVKERLRQEACAEVDIERKY